MTMVEIASIFKGGFQLSLVNLYETQGMLSIFLIASEWTDRVAISAFGNFLLIVSSHHHQT